MIIRENASWKDRNKRSEGERKKYTENITLGTGKAKKRMNKIKQRHQNKKKTGYVKKRKYKTNKRRKRKRKKVKE